jgi:hypothetical protein
MFPEQDRLKYVDNPVFSSIQLLWGSATVLCDGDQLMEENMKHLVECCLG